MELSREHTLTQSRRRKSYLKLSEKFVKLEVKKEKRKKKCAALLSVACTWRGSRRCGFFVVASNEWVASENVKTPSFCWFFVFRFSFHFRRENHSLQRHFSCNVRNIRLSQFKTIFALLVEPQMRMPHERIKLTRQWRWNGRRQLSRDKFEKVENLTFCRRRKRFGVCRIAVRMGQWKLEERLSQTGGFGLPKWILIFAQWYYLFDT